MSLQQFIAEGNGIRAATSEAIVVEDVLVSASHELRATTEGHQLRYLPSYRERESAVAVASLFLSLSRPFLLPLPDCCRSCARFHFYILGTAPSLCCLIIRLPLCVSLLYMYILLRLSSSSSCVCVCVCYSPLRFVLTQSPRSAAARPARVLYFLLARTFYSYFVSVSVVR